MPLMAPVQPVSAMTLLEMCMTLKVSDRLGCGFRHDTDRR